MKIMNAKWDPKVNWLVIKCECGREFRHRADRIKVLCPRCYRTADLMKLKDAYFDNRS